MFVVSKDPHSFEWRILIHPDDEIRHGRTLFIEILCSGTENGRDQQQSGHEKFS